MAASGWSEKGFSLLELMVALAVFVISIGVIIAAQTASAKNQAVARQNYVAVGLLRELLMNAETFGIPDSGDEETKGDFGDKFPGYTWKRKVGDAIVDAGLLSQAEKLGVDTSRIQAALPGIRMVTLEVDWDGGSAPGQAELVYYAVSPWLAKAVSH